MIVDIEDLNRLTVSLDRFYNVRHFKYLNNKKHVSADYIYVSCILDSPQYKEAIIILNGLKYDISSVVEEEHFYRLLNLKRVPIFIIIDIDNYKVNVGEIPLYYNGYVLGCKVEQFIEYCNEYSD